MALKPLASHDGESDSDGDSGSGIVAEINITPLVDIFLVLLIIFMVTSSVMSQLGVNVDLPQASQGTAESQPEGVIVTLLPGGALRLNDLAISRGDYGKFRDSLKKLFAKSASRLVILEGDRDALLGSAIEVMDHARQAGAQKFAIATTAQSASSSN